MEASERIAILETIMTQLISIIDEETRTIKALNLDELETLETEKSVLADAYAHELRKMRSDTSGITSVSEESRTQLFQTMRTFQEKMADNIQDLMFAQEQLSRLSLVLMDGLNANSEALTDRSARSSAMGDNVIALRQLSVSA